MSIVSSATNSVGRSVFTSMMNRITIGRLHVVEEGQIDSIYGSTDPKEQLQASLTIIDPYFYTRLLIHADIGFSESYILGEIKTDDLTRLLQIYIKNTKNLNNLNLPTASIGNIQYVITHNMLANTIKNSLSNISAHYDIGNELFTRFLGETMMYSSGVYAKDDPQGDALDFGQKRKLKMIMEKARLNKNDKVLEIGTGWGTFAIEAVKQYGCHVTSITLSTQQYEYALERVAELPKGLQGNVDVRLMDYRNLPNEFPHHSFTKIVSIEMIEAVGPQFLGVYFDVVNKMLHATEGVMVFQCITMHESRYEAYCKNVDFIQKFIFPGGHCPTVTALTNAITSGSNNQLIIDNVENIGVHYARTLREWRVRFLDRYDELKNYPKYVEKRELGSLSDIVTLNLFKNSKQLFYGEEFKRKWLYYLCYCEAGFKERIIGNVQMVIGRDGSWGPLQGKGLENFAL